MTTLHDPAFATDTELSLWPSSATELRRGDLTVGGVSLAELAERFGTPVYVLDEEEFRERCRTYRHAFPDAEVLYAAGAFLCPAMVRRMDEEGLGLDVCSADELDLAACAGFPPGRAVALAGRLARQQPGVVAAGTLQARGMNFVVPATGAALILALLNFLPALSLGPLADGLN